MGKYSYVAVCSAALGALAPTEGGEGWGHIVADARLQLVIVVVVVVDVFQENRNQKQECI